MQPYIIDSAFTMIALYCLERISTEKKTWHEKKSKINRESCISIYTRLIPVKKQDEKKKTELRSWVIRLAQRMLVQIETLPEAI